MKKLTVLVLSFVVLFFCIAKILAVLLPASLVYWLANAFGYHGDEAVLDFLVIFNSTLSALISFVLVVFIRKLWFTGHDYYADRIRQGRALALRLTDRYHGGQSPIFQFPNP